MVGVPAASLCGMESYEEVTGEVALGLMVGPELL
jgi:hypothetical protein